MADSGPFIAVVSGRQLSRTVDESKHQADGTAVNECWAFSYCVGELRADQMRVGKKKENRGVQATRLAAFLKLGNCMAGCWPEVRKPFANAN
jgi:hypothetical protein